MARRTAWGDLANYMGDAESRRGRALAAQDRIISSAGIWLGFVAAGADEALLLVADHTPSVRPCASGPR